jgi:hypothetical protein
MRTADILAAGTSVNPIGPTIFGILLFIGYWIPSVVAVGRHVRNTGSVVVVNLFFGWTVIGWIIALAMACRSTDRPAVGSGTP